MTRSGARGHSVWHFASYLIPQIRSLRLHGRSPTSSGLESSDLSMICRLRRPWTEAVVVLGVDAVLVYRKATAVSDFCRSERVNPFVHLGEYYIPGPVVTQFVGEFAFQ